MECDVCGEEVIVEEVGILTGPDGIYCPDCYEHELGEDAGQDGED